MEMIGHQAVAPDREPMLAGIATEKVQKTLTIGIGIEDLASIVPTLGDVMRQAGNDEPLAVPGFQGEPIQRLQSPCRHCEAAPEGSLHGGTSH